MGVTIDDIRAKVLANLTKCQQHFTTTTSTTTDPTTPTLDYTTATTQLRTAKSMSAVTSIYQNCAIHMYNTGKFSVAEKMLHSCAQLVRAELKSTPDAATARKLYKCLYVRCRCLVLVYKELLVKRDAAGMLTTLNSIAGALGDVLSHVTPNDKTIIQNITELQYEHALCHTLYSIHIRHTGTVDGYIQYFNTHVIQRWHIFVSHVESTRQPIDRYIHKALDTLHNIQAHATLHSLHQLNMDVIQICRQLCRHAQMWSEHNELTVQLATVYAAHELHEQAEQLEAECADTANSELFQLLSTVHVCRTIHCRTELQSQLGSVQQVHDTIEQRIASATGAKNLADVELLAQSYSALSQLYGMLKNYHWAVEYAVQCVSKCKAILKSLSKSTTTTDIADLANGAITSQSGNISRQTSAYNTLHMLCQSLQLLVSLYTELGHVKLAEYYSSILIDACQSILNAHCTALLACATICLHTGQHAMLQAHVDACKAVVAGATSTIEAHVLAQLYRVQKLSAISQHQHSSAATLCQYAIEHLSTRRLTLSASDEASVLDATLIELHCYQLNTQLHAEVQQNTQSTASIIQLHSQCVALLQQLSVRTADDILTQARLLLLLSSLYIQHTQLTNTSAQAVVDTTDESESKSASPVKPRRRLKKAKDVEPVTITSSPSVDLYDVTQQIPELQRADILQHKLYLLADTLHTRSKQHAATLQHAYKCAYLALALAFPHGQYDVSSDSVVLLTQHILSTNSTAPDSAVSAFLLSLRHAHYTRAQLLSVLQTKAEQPVTERQSEVNVANDQLFRDLTDVFNDLDIDDSKPDAANGHKAAHSTGAADSKVAHADVVQQQIDIVGTCHGLDTEFSHFEQMQSLLPAQWRVAQISLTQDWTHATVSMVQKDSVAVHRMPVDGKALQALVQQYDGIVAASDALNSSTKTLQTISNADKKQWWDKRAALNSEMQAMLTSVESVLLGWCKVYVYGQYNNTVLQAQVKASATNLLKQSDIKFLTSEQVALIVTAYPCLSSADIHAYIRAVMPAEVIVKPDFESQLMRATSVIQTACEQLYSDFLVHIRASSGSSKSKAGRRTKSIDAADTDADIPAEVLDKYVRKPLIVILPNQLQSLPIESMPLLRYSIPVSRMPSLPLLHAVLIGKQSQLNTKAGMVTGYDGSLTYYILNPNSDLSKTETTFRSKFEAQRGWAGRSSVVPSQAEMTEQLQSKHAYVYCGHSAGEQVLSMSAVYALHVKPVAMLMGCSSAKLRHVMFGGKTVAQIEHLAGDVDDTNVNDGYTYDPVGMCLAYLLSGSTAVVGNLYDVTDGDIDRFTEKLLSHTCYDGAACEHSVQAVVSQARSVCKLPYLMGAAPVVYGLPVQIIRS